MDKVIYIGEFDNKYSNKKIEASKIFLVSKLQSFRSDISYNKTIVEIFTGSKLFIFKNKAINFAETLTNNIHYIYYINQNYPINKL